MYRFIRELAALDRRIIYLVMVVLLSIPFVVHYTLPIYPDSTTRKFFEEVEEIAADPIEKEKIVIVLHNWGPGTSGENEPQFDVVMRHLIRRDLKFIFVCTIGMPEFHDTAMLAFEKALATERQKALERGVEPPNLVYGEDYLNFGYVNAPTFSTFAKDVVVSPRDLYGEDYENKRPLTEDASYPLLEQYRGIEDVSAVLVVSAGDESKDIVGLVKSQYPSLRVGPATMGIVANDLYPYVKSGQLFGMINSARGASEYRMLLDGDTTTPLDNAMSMGKSTLLVLLLLGNAAFLITRRAELSGKLPPKGKGFKQPLPPLPGWFMWSLFGGLVVLFVGLGAYDYSRYAATGGTLPRERAPVPGDQFGVTYYERVDQEAVEANLRAELREEDLPVLKEDRVLALRAEQVWKQVIERRFGEYLAALLTLGVLAFTLGDNRFYRITEAVIVGGSMAYLLKQIDAILRPDWIEPIVYGVTGAEGYSPLNVLWILLLIPGSLWYFTYSKKYRWLNQLIVALFIGFAIGPVFQSSINQILPQILDSVQPVWPWTPFDGGVIDPAARIEHLVFVIVLVLSLTYFVFSFRPTSTAGNGVLTAGRWVMMIGFGAMFGNTVNTRLSWLAPRIEFLWQDLLQKAFGG